MALSTVERHYEDHLAPAYLWMAGGWEAGLARGQREIDDVLPGDLQGRTAVDLGAGIGLHAIPLARRGCKVFAIDTSSQLLRTLRSHGDGLPIRTVKADLMSFQTIVNVPADIILCMGDTLTHLPDLPSVSELLKSIAMRLAHDGLFIATFRDYTEHESGTKRFINARGDAQRILTCFLEYAQDHVTVHDLLHEREGSAWKLSVSAYKKVRLSPAWMREALRAHGLCTLLESIGGGMVRLTARRF